MTDREQAKQIGREIVAAAETYLLAFIWCARTGKAADELQAHREALFAAIDKAIDAAEGR